VECFILFLDDVQSRPIELNSCSGEINVSGIVAWSKNTFERIGYIDRRSNHHCKGSVFLGSDSIFLYLSNSDKSGKFFGCVLSSSESESDEM
jgi:hypothetical protein